MKHLLNSKLKHLSMIAILLSSCSVCMICNGLNQPRCRMALPHVQSVLDSLYNRNFHLKKWAVTDCDCSQPDKSITITTITNPANGEVGIKVFLDSTMTLTGVSYHRANHY